MIELLQTIPGEAYLIIGGIMVVKLWNWLTKTDTKPRQR